MDTANGLDDGNDALLRFELWIETEIRTARQHRIEPEDVSDKFQPRFQIIDHRAEWGMEISPKPAGGFSRASASQR